MITWGTYYCDPVPRAGTVEVLVGLLAELTRRLDWASSTTRVPAVVTLTTMKRAVRLLHYETYRSVLPVGFCGSRRMLMNGRGTLDETPIAPALEEDRVVESGSAAPTANLAAHVSRAPLRRSAESAYLTARRSPPPAAGSG